MSKASSELVRRLTERSAEVTSLQGSLRTSEECWAEAERKLTEQASTLDSLRTDLQETSSSLAESRKQSADYRTAVADQLRLDQEAINQGRAERDAWRAGAVTGGIVAVVAAVVVVFR